MPGLLSCDDFFFQNCSDHLEMETKRLTEFTVADEAMMNDKFKINTKLLPIKAHYFLCYAAAAPVVPFVPIYAKQMGIDTIGVGVIFAGTEIFS